MTVSFTVSPEDTVSTEGGTVTFTCSVKGVPTPKVVWKKGGELVTNSSRYVVTSESLVVNQVTRDDMAVYSCISWNRGSVRVAQGKLLLKGSLSHYVVKCGFDKCGEIDDDDDNLIRYNYKYFARMAISVVYFGAFEAVECHILRSKQLNKKHGNAHEGVSSYLQNRTRKCFVIGSLSNCCSLKCN